MSITPSGTHLLKWQIQNTDKPNAGKDVKQKNHTLLVGIQNGIATSEDNLTFSYKTKHTFTL